MTGIRIDPKVCEHISKRIFHAGQPSPMRMCNAEMEDTLLFFLLKSFEFGVYTLVLKPFDFEFSVFSLLLFDFSLLNDFMLEPI